MSEPTKPASKLIYHRPLDAPDELDRKLYSHFYYMRTLVANKDELSAIEELKAQGHTEMNIALLYGILTDGKSAQQYYKYLSQICKDGFETCINYLQRLIVEKYPKILDPCRTQMLWISREFIVRKGKDVDNVIIGLLRQIAGGDLGNRNIWLANTLVDILDQNRTWLLSRSALIPYVFYTYTRIALDHNKKPHLVLRDKEATLCAKIWEERPADVALLGRELVRILNDAKEIPIFAGIWKQLRSVPDPQNSESLMEGPITVARLMSTKTPRIYLQSRVTKEMEDQLRFLMTHVNLGSQKRYQQWFAAKYLTTPESETLIPDLVRYICGVYHPSNQVLQSKVIPRWAVIGWLIKCCKRADINGRVKIALLFDYLYFATTDNIMNVEPAILLMVQSLRNYQDMTLSLLQCLCFAVEKYAASPFNCQMMKSGVVNAFSALRKFGVVPSLSPLIEFEAMEKMPDVKEKLRVLFPEHFNTGNSTSVVAGTDDNAFAQSFTQAVEAKKSLEGSSSGTKPLSPVRMGSPMRSSPSHRVASPKRSPSPAKATDPDPSTDNEKSESTAESMEVSSPEQVKKSPQVTTEPNTGDISTNQSMDAIPSSPTASDLSATSEESLSGPILAPQCLQKIQPVCAALISDSGKGQIEPTTIKDFLQAWAGLPNAQDTTAEAGTFLSRVFDATWCSQDWSPWSEKAASCSCQVFFDVATAATQQIQHNAYAPLISKLQKWDQTLCLKLLMYSVKLLDTLDKQEAFTLYFAVARHAKKDQSQVIIADICQSPNLDMAYAIMGASSDEAVEDAEKAVEVIIDRVIPALCDRFPKLVTGKEAILRFVTYYATPRLMQSLVYRVSLMQFSLLGTRGSQVLLTSLNWESYAQSNLWELAVCELGGVSQHVASNSDLVALWRKLLACIDPTDNPEALRGLYRMLSYRAPDPALLDYLVRLPERFELFPEFVMNTWCNMFPDAMINCILQSLTGSVNTDNEIASEQTISKLLTRLNALQKSCPTKSIEILQDERIKKAIQEKRLQKPYNSLDLDFSTEDSELEERPKKKQRTEDK